MATNPVFVNPDPLPRFDGEGSSCAAEAFVEEALRRLGHYKLADGAGGRICAQRTNRGEFGDKRDLATLLSTFHGRRQGVAEGVYQYAHALSAAATRANKKQAGSINDGLLRDRFIDGLYPPELRRDLKRFIRGNSTATFMDARAEALRWMRDDADAEVTLALHLSPLQFLCPWTMYLRSPQLHLRPGQLPCPRTHLLLHLGHPQSSSQCNLRRPAPGLRRSARIQHNASADV
nr:hypothetical protein BaRGS_014499 [Batillaria attramentaria]